MFSQYQGKGLSGMANLGNTCFINSCMQIISHTYEFNDLLDSEPPIHNSPDGIILKEWNDLRKMLWSENCIVSPQGWLRAVHSVAQKKGKDIFTGYAQNDLPEFLLFMLDCFHNALKRNVKMKINGDIMNSNDEIAKDCYTMMIKMYEKEYSEIIKLFLGIHISQIISFDRKVLSNHPEPFFTLDLPVFNKKGNTLTIHDCLNYYSHPEKLEGENAWFNEETNEKQDVYRRITFWKAPEILVIAFKRFTNTGRKLQMLIDFPLENFDFSPYLYNSNEEPIYDLFGICNHSGGTMGGHYTAIVKNANNNWYLFNDTNVIQINPDKIVTPHAYCLFYRKKK